LSGHVCKIHEFQFEEEVAAVCFGGAAVTVGEHIELQEVVQDKHETPLFIHQSVYQLNLVLKQSFEHISENNFFCKHCLALQDFCQHTSWLLDACLHFPPNSCL
jgi:hypothetical protein